QPGKVKFFSFKKGYHGTHFGGASVNGNDRFRKSYEPLLPGCIQLPFPSLYHNPFGIDDIDELTEVCLRQIEQEINYQGADSIAAFIAEPVLGAGGILVPPPNLWPALRALCDKYDILLIADEVVTGFGRTGSWFGARAWGVRPDMMCFAKAITSGYFPFGAVMLNERIETVFMESGPDGAIGHGYTYSGHPVGCAAALATLDVTFSQDLPGNALARGEQLMASLKALQAEHEMIGDVRGKGLMVGIELVADRGLKTPLDPQLGDALADRVFAAGAMIRVSGNIIIMSPPLVITESEINSLAQALSVGFAGA
ncbi:MAG TPA: aminotransferase class III-fold pyridoxal phosphate-dependent enzyme, partial [Gammaproteobacteria bacterium]|nr:aminotransferase class III-fold pyridoxal phosphate-dependent enzyme [Gammaproteobacteria bacterium]